MYTRTSVIYLQHHYNLYSHARYCFIIVLKQNWINGRFSVLKKENSIRKILIFARLE